MSAPVVRCFMWEYPDHSGHVVCDIALTEPTTPALAIPDALWQDEDFREACRERSHDMLTLWRKGDHNAPFPSFFDAIHAELRARASGEEE